MVTHNPELSAATDRSIHIKDGTIEKEVVNLKRQRPNPKGNETISKMKIIKT